MIVINAFVLLLQIANACTGPRIEDRNFELFDDYSYVNIREPMGGRGIGWSNPWSKTLESCIKMAEERLQSFREGETDGFILVKLKLVCRDLKNEKDYVYIDFIR